MSCLKNNFQVLSQLKWSEMKVFCVQMEQIVVYYFCACLLMDFEFWASVKTWAWVLMTWLLSERSLTILHKWAVRIAKNKTNKLSCDEHQAKVCLLGTERKRIINKTTTKQWNGALIPNLREKAQLWKLFQNSLANLIECERWPQPHKRGQFWHAKTKKYLNSCCQNKQANSYHLN